MVKKQKAKNETSLTEKIKRALEDIRPALQADGGDIKLIKVKNGVAYVKLEGFCSTCPFATLTLKNFIETTLKEKIPELKSCETI
jgi:Fe-S cluster biogenesis protein NfuA